MKRVVVIFLVLLSFGLNAQQGFHLGAEVSPSWNVNLQRQSSTGLNNSTAGYGFNIGVPMRYGINDQFSIQSGLTFEFMAFDERFNKTLISSNRHGSLHLPLMMSYGVTDAWYLNFGLGINYNFYNRQWTSFGTLDLGSVTNKFQPYTGLGLSTLLEQDKGTFELGVLGRFHFIDMYKPSTFSAEEFKNYIISLDLILRMYFL
ncbi:PorT family protein [Paracrocinitomix mangrovi]|uniref:outer membrane beta-barrel protein n=1 Tax=Paracrocinitomix mangrovi TaxID=2862509 RepID=UPI001C8D5C6F|nr:outer membrane beta-barrel protein [Paracrocinitomix mangrovi]UKN02659.1 PorT family protein [Paracrocinitomix mangrovi]